MKASETVLKPAESIWIQLKGAERIPSESNEPPNSNKDVSLPPASPNDEWVDSFSASDIDSDSKEELDSQHNPEHDASDQAGKNKNTYKSDDRFPAGRTVKWQELVT